MRVAENRGTPRADVVDVALAVGVEHVRTLPAREKARRATNRAKGADRRIDPTGDRKLRTCEEFIVAAHRNASALRAPVLFAP